MARLLYQDKNAHQNGFLGIELGSTRIKAVLINEAFDVIASGSYQWESTFENGFWTYSMEEAETGLKATLRDLTENLERDVNVCCMGLSGMMHGYLAFDRNWGLLVPFRTWQNTTTRQAAEELTELLGFNIPQRLSIAHLYQAVLNGEEHLPELCHVTTLAGYFHYLLTGVNAVCVDEASGMFPISAGGEDYDSGMMDKTERLLHGKGFSCTLKEILPQVMKAGDYAGAMSEEGSRLLDGIIPAGVPFAPATGDGGTGMVATNSVAPRTGNLSAGTSIFADIVLEKPLNKLYPEIDILTTPTGLPVAEIHGNNCTNDMNMYVRLFSQLLKLFGKEVSDNELFTRLYEISLEGDRDCDGVCVINYLAGECITHIDDGRPFVIRRPESNLSLSNFIRANLYGLFATMRIGLDLIREEDVRIDRLMAHGGVFKTKGVGQSYLAAAFNTAVTCMENAGDGGPYGMALLCAFSACKAENESLEHFLEANIFNGRESLTVYPEEENVRGFNHYMEQYYKCIGLEAAMQNSGI